VSGECGSNAVLDNRVSNLEKGFDKMSTAVESIAESLTTLARLEAHHEETRGAVTRSFKAIEKCEKKIEDLEESRVKKADCSKCHADQKELEKAQDTKIAAIEVEMPTLKLVRRWVIAGVMGIMGIFGVAVLHLVMK